MFTNEWVLLIVTQLTDTLTSFSVSFPLLNHDSFQFAVIVYSVACGAMNDVGNVYPLAVVVILYFTDGSMRNTASPLLSVVSVMAVPLIATSLRLIPSSVITQSQFPVLVVIP